MIKVYQRVIDGKRGDCLSACIASILDLDLDRVPNFFDPIDGISNYEIQSKKVNYWLATNGLEETEDLAYVRFGARDYAELWGLYLPATCVLSVPSQMFSGVMHAVVGTVFVRDDGILRYEIIHDPNPNNKPYPEDTEIDLVCFFVKRFHSNHFPSPELEG